LHASRELIPSRDHANYASTETAMPLKKQSFDPARRGPLAGVRVLDFSRLMAGNMLSLQLADFGAEVVKVEVPGTGDTLRHWRAAGVSAHWKVYARNKKSITLNLKAPEAPGVILDLVPHFHVLIESFRYRYLEKLGVGPDRLLEVNPKLVVTRVSGFGQTGPYAKRPGFGTLVEAMSGFASRNGFADREPVLPPLALADMVAGLSGAMATLAAVREVEVNGGAGQVVDVSLLDPMVSVLGPEALIYKLTGQIRKRVGSASESSSPRNVYATSDGGWVAISASTQAMTERLFRVIGRDDLNSTPGFQTNADRVKRRDQVDAIVGGWIGQRTLAENIAFFEEQGVTAAPVYDIAQFLADPHVQERGTIVETPDEELGEIPTHAAVPKLSGTPGTFRTQAPKIGEHNEEVYGYAGYSAQRLAALKSAGVI
jgi:crotonobetainyl-CoA:carnitine CoA-transferase CaiB-like acyl-CoA transferase